MNQFIYIPAEGDSEAVWLKLSTIEMVVGGENELAVFTISRTAPIAYFSGTQACILRAALSPAPKLPQLPTFEAAAGSKTPYQRMGAKHRA